MNGRWKKKKNRERRAFFQLHKFYPHSCSLLEMCGLCEGSPSDHPVTWWHLIHSLTVECEVAPQHIFSVANRLTQLPQRNYIITGSWTFTGTSKSFKWNNLFHSKGLRHVFVATVFSLSFKRQYNSTGDTLSYDSWDRMPPNLHLESSVYWHDLPSACIHMSLSACSVTWRHKHLLYFGYVILSLTLNICFEIISIN